MIIIFLQPGINDPATLVAHAKLQHLILYGCLSLLTRHSLREIAKALTHVLHTNGVGQVIDRILQQSCLSLFLR